MGLSRRGRVWHFVKRVPREYEHLDPRRPVRISLKTESETIARAKALAVQEELFAYWAALAAGRRPEARAHYDAAVKLARARGVEYRTAGELAAGPLGDLVERLERLSRRGELGNAAIVAAELGGVEAPVLPLSETLEIFLEGTRDRLAKKSPDQVRRWENPRRRAVANLIAVLGDKPLAELTREDALAYRNWWTERLRATGQRSNTANKDFAALNDVLGTVAEWKRIGGGRPFSGLRFSERDARTRPPFSADWIRSRVLAPGALDNLNDQARDVLLVMVETGLRPSEIVNLRAEDIVLEDQVPHLRVAADGSREFKSAASRRDVPLIGVSLEAARRHPGGFPRYRDQAAGWSAVANKFLRVGGLLETSAHVVYSLRHSFQDRLTAAEVPERIQADLMGHAIARPRYGVGPSLAQKRKWIEAISVSL